MRIIHRYNTKERQHFLLDKEYSFKIKPQLLYAGKLDKKSGWKDEIHSHEFAEIIFILGGRGKILIDGVSLPICKGDLVIYNAKIKHTEISSINEPLVINFLAFDNVNITDLPTNHLIPANYNCIYKSDDMYETFKNYFSLIITEAQEKKRFYYEITKNASRTLLLYIYRLINKDKPDANSVLLEDKSLDIAVKYIEENFLKNITLDDIANFCYLNKYYLSHLFTSKQGVPIKHYIIKKRIEYSKSLLLNTNYTLEKIAELACFSDSNYYCRKFKELENTTPTTYRKENRYK